MNRIKLSPLAKSNFLDLAQTDQTGPVSALENRPVANLLDYSLFIPQHYESNYQYPLVVWLHAEGFDHRQMLKLMPHLSTRNYAAIAVGSELLENAEESDDDFEDWNRNSWEQPCWTQSSAIIDQTAEKIHTAIDHARLRLNIDPSRIFVAGMGSGGTMAFRMAFSFPDWFAGVASINGSVPENFSPLSNWQQCRSVPVFWAHARQSGSFPESELCRQLKLLHIGGFSVTVRQYPCQDGQMNEKILSDANNWMMETISQSQTADSIIK